MLKLVLMLKYVDGSCVVSFGCCFSCGWEVGASDVIVKTGLIE